MRTVLIIDDEQMILAVGKRMLERRGDRVLLASGGAEGIRMFREHFPNVDVVLLDLLMPEVDGRECLRAIRSLDLEVPILLSTGYPGSIDATSPDLRGVAGLVRKPYDMKQLYAAIDRVTRHKRAMGA